MCAAVLCATWVGFIVGATLEAGTLIGQADAREEWSQSVRRASSLFQDGKTLEAEACLRRALQDASSLKIEPAVIAALWGALGSIYEDLGRIRESEQAYRKGLVEYERVLPQEDGRIMRALANLVLFYLRTNQLGRIEPLEARCRYLARTKPRTLEHGSLMNALGVLLYHQGRFEEAEAALAEALSIEEHAGGNAKLRNDIRANLGALYIATSRPDVAREVFREVIRDEELRIGEAKPELIPFLAGLAATCHLAGDDGEAKLVLERGIAIADAKLPSVHPIRFKLLANYAYILKALHRNKEAKKVERQAAALKRELERDYSPGLTVDISELSKKPASRP